MADINLFNDDAFSLSSMTAAINEQEYVPGRISSTGMFDEEGVTTTVVQIERDGDKLALVAAGERGTPAPNVAGSKPNLIPFNTVHLPQRASIKADEIQNLRAFGSDSELETLQNYVNRRLAKMRRMLDATHEFHRLGAIRGVILDADGKNVVANLLDSFGIKQQVVEYELSNPKTEIRIKNEDTLEAIEDALGNVPFTGARAFCGSNFWRKLLTLPTVKETFLNTAAAAALRGDPRGSIELDGIVFERYRGAVGGVPFVGPDEAYAVPEGVPDLFISRFAPGDYTDAVNTIGLPYYARQELMPFNKGVEIEAQSNPIHLCTRPRACIRLKA
ncbi:major capsid protein E [Burkholderia ubonensis]|uniref:major capsid protein n=1 Tax=Burkholderia ubonensis TaxID=101571 RepID=UPI00075FFE8A|nr:major capsid protein [Burkholderia ubonensis]KWO22007.1 major capsid protein E [Burkholderia ubonensis]OJB37490.1 major capsid protein E [Burkholderia ubonensis]